MHFNRILVNLKTQLNATVHFVMTKHPKVFMTITNTTRTYSWNSTDVYVSASEVISFPKGADNHNEIGFSLSEF